MTRLISRSAVRVYVCLLVYVRNQFVVDLYCLALQHICQFVQRNLTDGGHYSLWQLGRQTEAKAEELYVAINQYICYSLDKSVLFDRKVKVIGRQLNEYTISVSPLLSQFVYPSIDSFCLLVTYSQTRVLPVLSRVIIMDNLLVTTWISV